MLPIARGVGPRGNFCKSSMITIWLDCNLFSMRSILFIPDDLTLNLVRIFQRRRRHYVVPRALPYVAVRVAVGVVSRLCVGRNRTPPNGRCPRHARAY